MFNFHQYELSINDEQINTFGLLLSPFPLLHNPVREMDKVTWGKFNINYAGSITLTWIQKRKLQQYTTQLLSSISSDFEFKDLFIFPSQNGKIDLDLASTETEFLVSFITKLKTASIEILDIYKMPSHPNEFVPDDPNHHSQETYTDVRNLSLLNENEQIFNSINFTELFSNEFQFSPKSIFPINTNSRSFTLLKFISYFRYFLKSLPSLINLSKNFSFDSSFFPYLIESFTVEFIPSFTHHHNSLEKLGDTILGLCIVTNVIKALPGQPLYYINHKDNKLISNELFNTIGLQNDFPKCVIGPIDEEKVPADCFEAISGSVFNVSGYHSLTNFWNQRIFDIDENFIKKNQLSKTIKSMQLSLRNNITDVKPTKSMPKYAQSLFDSFKETYGIELNAPAQDAFTQGSEMQQKCKMIGAAFIKSEVAKTVFARMRKDEDILVIEQKSKKQSVQEIAEKIGFPSSRQIKVFVGGLFLTNSYEEVDRMFSSVFIPHFDLLSRRRKHHHRPIAQNVEENEANEH